MIKINTIYRTKDKYFIVVIRNPKYKSYDLHRSVWPSNLQDFDYLLKECNPLFVFDNLSDVRHFARKMIDGEDFSIG